RLEYLYRFLTKFGVEGALADGGVTAVSEWLPQYGGLLVEHIRSGATMWALYDFARPWTGELQGAHAVFDLGIYFGECVIARNPRLRWDVRVYDRPAPKPAGPTPLTGSGFEIEGLRRPKNTFDPIMSMHNVCCNIAADYLWRLGPANRSVWGDMRPN